jgi:DNA-binding NarL/FixJ family response regulator
MRTALPTVVVEKRLLVREALKSLMASLSYRVVCDVGSTAEIGKMAVSDEPKIVVLSAQSAADAVDGAVALRKLWPDSKILVLFDHAPPADVHKLLASEIDGCIPLSASPTALTSVLDMSVRGTRIVVVPSAKGPEIQPAQLEQSHQPKIALSDPQWSRERSCQQGDRSLVRDHRGDGQGPSQDDRPEDPGREPHPGGRLGAGTWPSSRQLHPLETNLGSSGHGKRRNCNRISTFWETAWEI